jgi:transcriptional regulator with XRE-family HTH domain
MKKNRDDSQDAMKVLREKFEQSGLTLHDLGVKMGYPDSSARKSAWQFIAKTEDPRLSMLRKFAEALGVDLKDIV